MTLTWPWGLLSLSLVAAAAFWALRRPVQRTVPVSSLELWTRTLDALPASAKRSARRLTPAWALLLAGALAAGLALARPAWRAAAPARRLAVAVCPAAELGPEGLKSLRDSAAALLGRLGPGDRVRLILPAALGGAGEPAAPEQAARRVAGLKLLAASAEDLALPDAADDVQHVYRFVPATLAPPEGPRATTIPLPAVPGEVTIDAFAAEPLAEGGVEAFLALRNHAGRRVAGTAVIGTGDGAPIELPFELPGGSAGGPPARARRSLIRRLPGRPEYIWAAVRPEAGPPAGAFLARRSAATARVAMIGRDDPLLRKFLRVHPALEPAAGPDEADAVIAVGTTPTPGKPALVIDPPSPPPGYTSAEPLEDVALRGADLASDHELLAPGELHRRLGQVAVRHSSAWRRPEVALGAELEAVVGFRDRAVVLAGGRPRRIWVGFDLAPENTNFATQEAFVIFLANAVRYLLPRLSGDSGARYESAAPLAAGAGADWAPLAVPAAPGEFAGPLPAPGLYRDAGGEVHAVSLAGLRSARPAADPLKTVAALTLPAPQPVAQAVALWPALLALACLLWLAGWAVRTR